MARTLSIVLSLLCLTGALLVPDVGVAHAAAHAAARADASAGDYVGQARSATNQARSQHGRSQVGASACLDRAARQQAARMARRGELFHSHDLRSVARRCGLRSWAENVAQAPGADRGRGVVRQWMASSGHRTNILNPDYRLLGMGAVRAQGSWWVVQVFGRKA